MARKAAAAHAQQEEFSAAEMKKLAEGQVVKPKFKVRNGATEQEWKWREYYNEHGNYADFESEICAAFDEEVSNCPVPKDEAEASDWVHYMVKKWSDPQTGYGLAEDTVKLLSRRAVNHWLGAVKEEKEIKVIERFLPKQLSIDETKDIIKNIMAEIGASSIKDMGKVMGALKAKYAGQLDFGKANGIVKSCLS